MVDRYAVGRMWSADTLRELSRGNVRAGEIFTRGRLAVNRWAVPQPRRVSSLESRVGARGCQPRLARLKVPRSVSRCRPPARTRRRSAFLYNARHRRKPRLDRARFWRQREAEEISPVI